MSRVHWWNFVVDETGIPIESVEIYVYLSGGTESADIFVSETGAATINSVPSTHGDYVAGDLITTDANGYFDFWVEDEWGSVSPYDTDQKFKVAWYKDGAADGNIDDISIFPVIVHPVDELDTDTVKDKTVSNNQARLWTSIYTAAAPSASWAADATEFKLVVNHALTSQYPIVQVWNTDDGTFEAVHANTVATDANNMTVFINDNVNAQVTIIG